MVVGPEELRSVGLLDSMLPPPPCPENLAEKHNRQSHILIWTPNFGTPDTINKLYTFIGTAGEPSFYGQSWYWKEEFANRPLDGKWHLLPLTKSDADLYWGEKRPFPVPRTLVEWPSAITLTFAFFAYYLLYKEPLWKHDFLWTSDADHRGDRVYVGQYKDPTGWTRDGWQIHRLLTIDEHYGAVQEIA